MAAGFWAHPVRSGGVFWKVAGRLLFGLWAEKPSTETDGVTVTFLALKQRGRVRNAIFSLMTSVCLRDDFGRLLEVPYQFAFQKQSIPSGPPRNIDDFGRYYPPTCSRPKLSPQLLRR